MVKDLDSTNGTFLNGERIQTGRARPGDRLRFDVVTFNVVGPSEDSNQTVVRPAGTTERWAAADSAISPPDRHSDKPSAHTTSRRSAPASATQASAAPASGPKKVAGTRAVSQADKGRENPAKKIPPLPADLDVPPPKPRNTMLPIMVALLIAVCIAAGVMIATRM